MLTYVPIIAAIEAGEKMSEDHPAVVQCTRDCLERFGEEPYLGGADDLVVVEVHGPYCVTEYDGAETVHHGDMLSHAD